MLMIRLYKLEKNDIVEGLFIPNFWKEVDYQDFTELVDLLKRDYFHIMDNSDIAPHKYKYFLNCFYLEGDDEMLKNDIIGAEIVSY